MSLTVSDVEEKCSASFGGASTTASFIKIAFQLSEISNYVKIRSIYKILDYTVEENIPGLLIFIDFEKAFDSVQWDFPFKCFEAFNLAQNFFTRLRGRFTGRDHYPIASRLTHMESKIGWVYFARKISHVG